MGTQSLSVVVLGVLTTSPLLLADWRLSEWGNYSNRLFRPDITTREMWYRRTQVTRYSFHPKLLT